MYWKLQFTQEIGDPHVPARALYIHFSVFSIYGRVRPERHIQNFDRMDTLLRKVGCKI